MKIFMDSFENISIYLNDNNFIPKVLLGYPFFIIDKILTKVIALLLQIYEYDHYNHLI